MSGSAFGSMRQNFTSHTAPGSSRCGTSFSRCALALLLAELVAEVLLEVGLVQAVVAARGGRRRLLRVALHELRDERAAAHRGLVLVAARRVDEREVRRAPREAALVLRADGELHPPRLLVVGRHDARVAEDGARRRSEFAPQTHGGFIRSDCSNARNNKSTSQAISEER